MKTIQILHTSIIVSLFLLFGHACQGIELDTSIDKEISKKYNTYSIEENLPDLPAYAEPEATKSKPSAANIPSLNVGMDNYTAVKVSKGTKFKAISKTGISDYSTVGNKVVFSTTKPVTKRYITIPANSIIRGKISDTHPPQLGGNGGLIKIDIESITIDNAHHYADGKITKANGKNIFLNNIKGRRKYASAIKKSISKSNSFFQKSMRETAHLANDKLTVLLSPFTFVGGVLIYTGRVVISPITSLSAKGDRVSIPSDSLYEIKLTKDLYLYN